MEIALTNTSTVEDADARLIHRMAAGDQEALRTLFAAYGRRLFAYALRVTGNHAVAEEVLQDSLLAAWKGAPGFRGEAQVATWLLGIVHRQALNAVRRKRLPATGLDAAGEAPDDPGKLDDHVAAADRRRALGAALARLSPEHRTVLQLVFYQGLAMAEVAEICGCPIGTVKSRMSYAKAQLRKALGAAGLSAEDLL